MMQHKPTYEELERQLVEANNRNIESERLINAFLSNVSHEIRTPLNSILGFSELLREPDLSEPEREEYFGYIDNKCSYLLNFVDNIIDLARIESRELQIERSKTDINQMMNLLYLKYKAELKKFGKDNIELRLSKANHVTDFIVNTDPKRLKQVLSNILNNAIKFTNEGFIEFGYHMKSISTLEFYVKDSGIGFPEYKKEDIFEKFQVVNVALSKKIGGAGLGLTISRNLIKLLGGEVWVESQEGIGTTFFFTIPLNRSESELNTFIPSQEKLIYNWHSKTILVAEDVEMNYMFIEAALRKTKVKLLWAKDGQEAVEIIKNRAESTSPIDLVLMDIQMPFIDGYEATKKIKQINNYLPIISHTAYDIEEEVEKSLLAGCDDYLPKPVTANMLINKLSEYMRLS